MARPFKLPILNPRQPRTVLAWSMQKQRLVHGWSGKQVADYVGCSPGHISRVELGHKSPSPDLVQCYEQLFGADGLLLSLLATTEQVLEERRREPRKLGTWPLRRAAAGDASTFIDDTVPNGSRMAPGEVFFKQWRIQNSGTVAWHDRALKRQGPITGPGLITSPPYLAVPNTLPGDIATIVAPLKAPTYDCSSIAYFKMVDAADRQCFPDNYQLGLEVIVLVRGQLPDQDVPASQQ